MKNKLCIGLSVLALTACGQQQEPADPSTAQQQSAKQAYDELSQGKFEQFMTHLDPQLQRYFQENQKVLKKFARSIPKESYKSQTLMSKKIEQQGNKSQYKVSYEIAYPGNLVQYDVSFDQPGGSHKIQDFNIRVFGKSS